VAWSATAAYGKIDFFTQAGVEATPRRPSYDITNVTQMRRAWTLSSPRWTLSAGSGSTGAVTSGATNKNKGIGDRRASATETMNKVRRCTQRPKAGASQGGRYRAQTAEFPTGTVGRKRFEIEDDKLGLIASDELNPQKARISAVARRCSPKHTREEMQMSLYTY
jgi:hypothetical protein